MTDIAVPVTTFWDVLGDAFGDPVFWYLTVAGVLIHALPTRILLGRWHRRYRSRPGRDTVRPYQHGTSGRR